MRNSLFASRQFQFWLGIALLIIAVLLSLSIAFAADYPWQESTIDYDPVYWQDPEELAFEGIPWGSCVPVLPARSFGANFVKEDTFSKAVYPHYRFYGYNYYFSKALNDGVSLAFLQERFPDLVLPAVLSSPGSLPSDYLWVGVVCWERGTDKHYITLHGFPRSSSYDGLVVRLSLGYNVGAPFDFTGFMPNPLVAFYGYDSEKWYGSASVGLQNYTDSFSGVRVDFGYTVFEPRPAYGYRQGMYDGLFDRGIMPLWVGAVDPLSTDVPNVKVRADYPWGKDPVPLEFGSDIYPTGQVLNWEYIRQFSYVPKYDDMLRLVANFGTSPVGYTSQMYYLISRHIPTGRYEVTLFGDRVPDGSNPGIFLKCSQKFLGLVGHDLYSPQFTSVLSSSKRVSGFADFSAGYSQRNVAAKAKNVNSPRAWYRQEREIVSFGVFDPGSDAVVVPDPVVPPVDPQDPYTPGDESGFVEDDYGFWGGLFRDLFVPRNVDYLPVVRLFGNTVEPILDFFRIFTVKIEPRPPVVLYEGADMMTGFRSIFEYQVSAFGITGTIQQVVQTLGGISLTLVMLRSLVGLVKKAVGG